MGKPYVTSFCCCMGVEIGAMIVGILHLTAALVLTTICSVWAREAGTLAGSSADVGDGLYSRWRTLLLALALLSALHILLAITLLVGVRRRNLTLVCVWWRVMLAVLTAALLYVIVSAAVFGFSTSGSEIFIAFLEGLLFFGFLAYCITCVYSYSLVLRSAKDMEGPQKSHI